jgi:hypothetical protein
VEDYTTLILAAGAAITVIIVATVAWAVVRRRRRRRALEAPLPLIPFSTSRAGTPPPPPRPFAASRPSSEATNSATPVSMRTVGGANGRDGDHERFAPTPAADVQAYADVARDTAPMARSPSFGEGAAPEASRPPARAVDGVDGALTDTAFPRAAAGSTVEGTSVRYWRPADGTLQFLPGRLEVIAGRDTGHEIRFVRTPGPDGTQVTFGRAEGAPYRHIQLREPTVSRSHARMTLEAALTTPLAGNSTSAPVARWRLENLSATNPVVVNGRALGADGGETSAVTLEDGDRIEMGEVVFRFYER